MKTFRHTLLLALCALAPFWCRSVHGAEGKIGFVSDRDGITEIHVMNTDGTELTRLTNHRVSLHEPSWSPDGLKIVFASSRENGDSEIYVMNADGTGLTNISNNSAFDGYPSWIKGSEASIFKLELQDLDNTPLQFLSTDEHTYKNGFTVLNGRLVVKGAPTDQLSEIKLEVVQGTTVLATALLAGHPELLEPFGDDGKVTSGGTPTKLFKLPTTEGKKVADLFAPAVGPSVDGKVKLRVRVKTTTGQEATLFWGGNAAPKEIGALVRYKKTNRFGSTDRDSVRGGDDWVLPSVRPVCEFFDGKGVKYNDFSNMNGGSFAPDHVSHQIGNDVDGRYPGYYIIENGVPTKKKTQAAALQMIDYLNQAHRAGFSQRIKKCWVTFRNNQTGAILPECQEFWDAIKDVTLEDGRLARDVIIHYAGHADHFHWRIMPPTMGTATASFDPSPAALPASVPPSGRDF